ncbi:MAG: hypothetical protein HW412_573 [Bacteroidetes bacterium]|nr:hypothetical protein [Bacteroidota bacterium]
MKNLVVTSVDDISDAYTKRIISNVIGKDPLKILARTTKRLRKLTKGLKKKQVRHQPAPGKWSIVQIVSHLADTELVLAWRLRMVLAQAGSPLTAMDQDKWANNMKYEENDLDEQLKMFTVVRECHLAIWNSLGEDDWEKFGMHEERGKETVARIVQHYAGHDINHLNQIEAIRSSFKKGKKK